jgi:Mlc titration factor MtfA (ptsG expression regulator)
VLLLLKNKKSSRNEMEATAFLATKLTVKCRCFNLTTNFNVNMSNSRQWPQMTKAKIKATASYRVSSSSRA